MYNPKAVPPPTARSGHATFPMVAKVGNTAEPAAVAEPASAAVVAVAAGALNEYGAKLRPSVAPT